MKVTPPTAAELLPKLAKFKQWLNERGAELLAPTNDFEVVRFKSGNTTTVIYRKKQDQARVTFLNQIAEDAWFGFTTGSAWRANEATERKPHLSNANLYETLRQRDGDECFYCAEVMHGTEATIEHLISLAHRGPEHISNKFLAHFKCNNLAGNLSAAEKIRIYHQARLKKAMRELQNVNSGRRSDCEAGNADLEASCQAAGGVNQFTAAYAGPAEA